MTARFRTLAIPALVGALTLGCVATVEEPGGPAGSPAPEVVAAHSPEVVSTAGPLKVRFVQPVVAAEDVGAPAAEGTVRVEPPLPGVALWTSRRDLEFRPSERLEPGRRYRVTVSLPGTAGREPVRFAFEVTAARQAMEIQVDGLTVDGGLRLTGRLTASDVADPEAVERVLAARQDGRELPVEWEHLPGGLRHEFTVAGIEQGDEPSGVTLIWDGTPIGAAQKGETTVTVPVREAFEVLDIRAVQGDQQYIEVRLSAEVAEADLRGLVTVAGRKDLRTVRRGNVVRIYTTGVWSERETVVVVPQLRSVAGRRLGVEVRREVEFGRLKPSVRFAGRRVILPTTSGLTLPLEVANLRSLIVEALQVYDSNVPQFLQVNDLDGENDLSRVGRVVWSDVVDLGTAPGREGRWVRYGLDLTPLVEHHPGGLYRIRVRFRPQDIVYPCPAGSPAFDLDLDGPPQEEGVEASFWDTWEAFQGFSWSELYENRFDPCHPGYYREYGDHRPDTVRNVLVSDLGIIAKSGGKRLFVAVTDLRSARPIPGAAVEILDFQQGPVASGITDSRGFVLLEPEREPFLAVVRHGGQVGYLKLDDGSALSLSRFDVAGAEVARGIRGFLYGERGVWRPGDAIHLTFVLFDPEGRLPPDHPVRLEFRDPSGQLVSSETRTEGMDGFYAFELATGPDAPTGSYHAVVTVGGATFRRTVRVETIRPNRLDLSLDLDRDMVTGDDPVLRGTLSAAWLHGAVARDLKATVGATLRSTATTFERYAAYTFDDPTRSFEPEEVPVFEGRLDHDGRARVSRELPVDGVAPGLLRVDLEARVFEPGGAASTEYFQTLYSPWRTYVGLLMPEGDAARGMLLTDRDHRVHLVAVGPGGDLRPGTRVRVKVFKLEWRWWWEKDGDDLADFVASREVRPIRTAEVDLADGQGSWTFRIDSPEWGRFLVLVEDMDGGHRAGRVVYVDWPGWAGRGGPEVTADAAMLALGSDREVYHPGDEAVVTVPTSASGRGLVSLESATGVLATEWIEGTGETVRYAFRVTPEMAPNIYVHVTFVQPHLSADNDLPIRMYGVIPIRVEDPGTHLEPMLHVPEVFQPEGVARFGVSEATGRPMVYTVAVVDEGLLGVTGFRTPDPWRAFYRREALGVKTWDLYDQVAGAYSGVLERLLAVGGDGEGTVRPNRERANRFPPLVRFLGPFRLAAGARATHEVEIPAYVGAVRVMAVAGAGRAFGSAEARVTVRKPVMVLGTLPRVLGPGETVTLPVSVFVMEDGVDRVEVEVAASGALALRGPSRRLLDFDGPGDRQVFFRVAAGETPGTGNVVIVARGGGDVSRQFVEMDVRSPALPVVDVSSSVLQPGESWEPEVEVPGLPGTGAAVLEVSSMPPMDLGRRLGYLVRYPYGCSEQTTSAAFAQLALARVVDLSPGTLESLENNVRAGIQRLRGFQTPEGGFSLWPVASGGFAGGRTGVSDEWVSSWVGHFLLEARRAGYVVPAEMLGRWRAYQSGRARSWITGLDRSQLVQAYRLFTLALAGAPEPGAMNRLLETEHLAPAAAWRLAAAYQLAGRPEAARGLARGLPMEFPEYRELGGTFGSELRDEAMVLESLVLMGGRAEAEPLVQRLSRALSGLRPLNTQATAWALVAMARAAGGGGQEFSWSWDGGTPHEVTTSSALWRRELPLPGGGSPSLSVRNRGDGVLYPRLVLSGLPVPGRERPSAQGMALEVAWEGADGTPMDPGRLPQGTDLTIRVTVTNTGGRGPYENVALTVPVASGWEIRNARLAGGETGVAGEHRDVRDDRVHLFFSLGEGEERTFEVRVNASYEGRFWLPVIQAEAMYDARINARLPGRWVEVVRPGGGEDGE